jgi:hypothetical protein
MLILPRVIHRVSVDARLTEMHTESISRSLRRILIGRDSLVLKKLMSRLVCRISIPLGKLIVIIENEEEWNRIIILIP